MKVSDDMVMIAQRAYLNNEPENDPNAEVWGKIASGIKAALEAVFDHISQKEKKVEPEITSKTLGFRPAAFYGLFPYRCSICGKGKHSINGECDCGGSKQEPKKQSLWELFVERNPIVDANNRIRLEDIKLISEYLDRNDNP